jgi:CRP-like cAMP-binding protein
MDRRALLESVPFFNDVLTGPELDALAAKATEVTIEPGAALISERDVTDSLFIIASGEVSVAIDEHGAPKHVATLGPGEIVGEMSLMTGAPRAATVTATTLVTALEIDKPAMRSLLIASPHLFERFADMLHKRQVELDALYGSGFWAKLSPRRENVVTVMRRYFG